MRRCAGLSYNGWLHIMPRSLVDQFIATGLFTWCRRHRGRLLMTQALRDSIEMDAGLPVGARDDSQS